MNKYNLKYPLRGETIIENKLTIVDIKEFNLEKDEFILDYKDVKLKSDDFNSFIIPLEVFKDICISKKVKIKSEIIKE